MYMKYMSSIINESSYNNDVASLLCIFISLYYLTTPNKKWVRTTGKIINIIRDKQDSFTVFVILHNKGKVRINHYIRGNVKLQDIVQIEYNADNIYDARFTSVLNIENYHIAFIFLCIGLALNKHFIKSVKSVKMLVS